MPNDLPVNTKVKVADTGVPPEDVQTMRDIRANPRTTKQLIEGFWRGQRGVSGQVAYVQNESDRERLRRAGKIMIVISDLSAQKTTIVAPVGYFRHA